MCSVRCYSSGQQRSLVRAGALDAFEAHVPSWLQLPCWVDEMEKSSGHGHIFNWTLAITICRFDLGVMTAGISHWREAKAGFFLVAVLEKIP